MKKNICVFLTFCAVFFFCTSITTLYGTDPIAKQRLQKQYKRACDRSSSTFEHIPILRQLAMECSSVVEIGLRTMTSSWGLLQGLSENPSPIRSYIGIDIVSPPRQILKLANKLAEAHGISFTFWNVNDMNVGIPPVELLFIDSLHTYCHLTYELEKFSPNVSKYIALHDTSPPWGYVDDTEYTGDYSEYPPYCDRSKRGLWPAVEDFLKRHPEWTLHERRLNCYGFTILKRVAA